MSMNRLTCARSVTSIFSMRSMSVSSCVFHGEPSCFLDRRYDEDDDQNRCDRPDHQVVDSDGAKHSLDDGRPAEEQQGVERDDDDAHFGGSELPIRNLEHAAHAVSYTHLR